MTPHRSTKACPQPRWVKGHRTLYFGEEIVKLFQVPAGNQEAILDEFERLGWPAGIKSPLPHRTGMNPKYRLHFTIGRLNSHRRSKRIEFFGNGTDREVGWRVVE